MYNSQSNDTIKKNRDTTESYMFLCPWNMSSPMLLNLESWYYISPSGSRLIIFRRASEKSVLDSYEWKGFNNDYQ